MLGRTYPGEVCSAARALEVVGERWTLLIVRDAMMADASRFGDFQLRLGLAPNILAKRLRDLVSEGIFERGDHGEYLLTAKGMALQPVLLTLTAWGDQWAPDPRGRPITYRHVGCGGEVLTQITCTRCDASPKAADVTAEATDWAKSKVPAP